MDEEITDQSTKLRNLNSIQSYKWNTTKNMVNTESAHMKVKVHKCYITKSNTTPWYNTSIIQEMFYHLQDNPLI